MKNIISSKDFEALAEPDQDDGRVHPSIRFPSSSFHSPFHAPDKIPPSFDEFATA